MHIVQTLMFAMLVALPAAAQDMERSDDTQDMLMTQPAPPRENPRSAAGQAGQRQTRQQVAQDTGIEPMGRINSRIQNRVQSRIRNRIDRLYDPQANATAPFVVAGDQLRTTARPRR